MAILYGQSTLAYDFEGMLCNVFRFIYQLCGHFDDKTASYSRPPLTLDLRLLRLQNLRHRVGETKTHLRKRIYYPLVSQRNAKI